MCIYLTKHDLDVNPPPQIGEQKTQTKSKMCLHGQVLMVNTREESGVLRRLFVMVKNRQEIAKVPQTNLQKV